MNEYIIKLRFGLSIDPSKPHPEPCPKCGRVVCQVKENNEDVFCTNSFCSFHDKLNHSHYNYIIDLIKRDSSYGRNIYFNDNQRYPYCNLPFILHDEFVSGKYIVRDFEVDYDEYNSPIARRAGLSKESCVNKDSKIIARYSSLQLLVEDGWFPNHDRSID